uniref:hypothetical protein n=1 Tax=Burkholderia anthina TaxID=179879 RepID=UPI00158D9940|nr:hypothetical protein [Burkholderia anthina]
MVIDIEIKCSRLRGRSEATGAAWLDVGQGRGCGEARVAERPGFRHRRGNGSVREGSVVFTGFRARGEPARTGSNLGKERS